MRSIAYVVKTGPEGADVLLGKHAQCVRCGGCLAAADDTQRRIKVSNEIGAAEGVRVEIEVSPGLLVGAAFLMFMLPVFVALAGGYAGYRLAGALGGPPTLIGIGLGCLAFAASFLVLKVMGESGRKSALPRIIRILSEDETEGGC
jgi:positive regulator of sigma E activity